MKGKFRKRSEGVWCPKPQMTVDLDKCTPDQRATLADLLAQAEKTFHETGEFKFGDYNKYRESLPQKIHKLYTGWTNMMWCEGCPSLEEFHIDGEGVFCLYPNENDAGEQKE